MFEPVKTLFNNRSSTKSSMEFESGKGSNTTSELDQLERAQKDGDAKTPFPVRRPQPNNRRKRSSKKGPLRLYGGAGASEETIEAGIVCGSCCCCTAIGIVVLTFLIILFGSWRKLEVQDVALARSKIKPILINETIPGPGVRVWPGLPLFPGLIVWPQREQQVVFEKGGLGIIKCNSNDGLEIDLDVSFQYKIEVEKLFELTQRFKNFAVYSQFLEDVARSDIQHACGDFSAEDFQKRRNEVAERVSENLSADLESKLSAIVSQTQLRNIERPEKYDDAVRDKEDALNEIKLAKAERAQATTKAQTDLEKKVLQGIREIDNAYRDAEIEVVQAEADAESTINEYRALAEVYTAIKENRNLSSAGILSYIANEIFSGTGVDTKLALQAPSKMSYQDEL